MTLDLDGASLDADANPIGASWVTLTNVLSDLPGFLRKRGAITNAGANADNINDAAGALAFIDSAKLASTTFRPYVGACIDGANTELYLQHAATSRVLMDSSTSNRPLPTSKCPTIDGLLVVCGRNTGDAIDTSRPGTVHLVTGSPTAAYSTGTVTVTSGSTTVTGSGTSWTSAMVGMFFLLDVTPDAFESAYYRVSSVASSTSLTLERAYAGGSPGAGQAYQLQPIQRHRTTTSGVLGGTAGDLMLYKVACAAWGRLAVGNVREITASAERFLRSRIRWSGVVGSDEGPNAAAIGIYGFDADGYLDLPSQYGEILALAPWNDAVLAFQESGLTVLRGTPVYDGAGSLDASEIHRGVAINGGFAFESTPEGVFFFDKNVGPCVYDGSRIVRIGDKRVTRTMLPYGITAVGYYDGKVLFSGTTLPGIFVFDTATGQWSLQVPPAIVSCLIAGRVENDEDVVGLGGGVRVVNLTNMFDNPGVAASDWDGTAIIADVKTGKISDPIMHLRPERAYVTYRLTDLSTTNPYLTMTTTTGLPDTSSSQHTHANGNAELAETVDVETRVLELNLAADPMTQIRMLQVNAAGKLEIYSVVVDCTIEGEAASS